MKTKKLLLLVFTLICVLCLVFSACKTKVNSNSIGNLEDISLTCGDRMPTIAPTSDYGEVEVSIAKAVDGTDKENLSYVPSADGYEFDGWVIDGTETKFESGTWKRTENITLVAQWTKLHTVTFIQEGQSNVTRIVRNGEAVKEVPPLTQKTGYTVVWNVTDFSNITSDLEVHAVETANKYQITYKLNSVTANIADGTTQQVTYDVAFTLQIPTADGYDFDGWVIEGQETKFESGTWNRTENITLVAQWTKLHTVTFIQEGQPDVERIVRNGEAVQKVPTPASKTGYTVVWNVTDFANIQSDLTVTAVETANKYQITYKLNGVTANIADGTTQQVTYDIAFTLQTPEADGYDFDGWVIEETETKFEGGTWNRTENITLVAQWTKLHTVTFIQEGQSDVKCIVRNGEAVKEVPPLTQKTGYTIAWDVTDFANIQSDLTVTAVETANKYQITYKLNGITANIADGTTQEVTFDNDFELYVPSAQGYKFAKWVVYGTEEEMLNGKWTIDGNVTLLAQWIKLYTVTFQQNGETIATREVEKGATLTDVPQFEPRTGYEIKWEDVDLTNIQDNITVHTVETAKTYTITYKLNGVTANISDGTTQEVTFDDTFTLQTPTASGYTFLRWVVEGTNEEISSGTWNRDSDVTLVAVWGTWSDWH